MDRIIYTAMTAASQALVQQSITTHNLSNVSTPGFRAQLAVMRAVPIKGDSLPTRTLVSTTTPMFDSAMGQFDYTERALDVALADNHWLAVQLPDGREAYTRHGNIQVDAEGTLTVYGYPLVGERGVLSVPLQSSLSIGTDGVISVIGAGNTRLHVGKIKRVEINQDEIIRGDDRLFYLTPEAQRVRGTELDDNPTTKLMSGVLEGSNVNPVSSMIDLISHSRKFDMQMKVIQCADADAQKSNQILSLT